jgi:hypothetical protein
VYNGRCDLASDPVVDAVSLAIIWRCESRAMLTY